MNKLVMFFCILGLSGQSAFAVNANMKMKTMTTEQRKKMADSHEKMAACLRTDKPLIDCHEEMMNSCKETMGKDGCTGMGHGMDGKMGHGKHHHSMHDSSDEE